MLSRLMTVREQLVIGFIGAAILVGALVLLWTKSAGSMPAPVVVDTTPAAPVGLAPAAAPAEIPAAPPAREIVVSVQGAVVVPGVYHLEDGSRITDLVKAAGGLARADTSQINLAARLLDGTTLIVPRRIDDTTEVLAEEAAPVANPSAYTIVGQSSVSTVSKTAVAPGRINLNTATQSELESLPGIGPKLAQQIIVHRESRPFGAVSELMDVPGIGPQKFDAVQELVNVD